MKDAVAVFVGPRFFAPVGAGKVKLATEAAVIAFVGEQFCDQGRALAPLFIAVHAGAYIAGVATGQETGAAWRADWALTEGVGKGDTFGGQAIQIGCSDVWIAEGLHSVEALLIGAEPEDVGAVLGHHGFSVTLAIVVLSPLVFVFLCFRYAAGYPGKLSAAFNLLARVCRRL